MSPQPKGKKKKPSVVVSFFNVAQMATSYVSSRVDSFSPSSNDYPNGNSPAIQQNTPGVSPVIRKKLMGYVGFANLPNQVHRKSVRKGFQFTAMVVGLFLPLPLFSHFLLIPSKANPASESLHSLTLSSTRLFTLPSNLSLPPPSVQRLSPSRASVQVCPPPHPPLPSIQPTFHQISRRMVSVCI